MHRVGHHVVEHLPHVHGLAEFGGRRCVHVGQHVRFKALNVFAPNVAHAADKSWKPQIECNIMIMKRVAYLVLGSVLESRHS